MNSVEDPVLEPLNVSGFSNESVHSVQRAESCRTPNSDTNHRVLEALENSNIEIVSLFQ